MKKKKINLIEELQKKHAEILKNFSKLQKTIRAETIEKKKAQEELLFLQEYSHQIIKSAAEGILTCDTDYRLTSFSSAAERLLSYRSEEILGNQLHKLFEKPEDFIGLNNHIIKDGCVGNFESTLISKNEKKIPVMLSFSYLKNSKGKPLGLVGIIRDLREIKDLQAQLLQSGKLAAIGQLAAGVAHEINNPLTIASSHIQLLLSEAKAPELKSTLKTINSELDRCTDITQGLLSFSRESKIKKHEDLDLNECIKSSLFLLKHKLALSNIKLIMRLAGNLPKVRGNYNQIQQVFLNLFFNALDAMPKGGSLYINTNPLNKKFVKITVTDTGIGIGREDLPCVFEPFYTTKEPGRGVGLGLSISYGIIKDHAGEITVKSHMNKRAKTTFTITLPASVRRRRTSVGRPVSKKRK